MGPCRVFKYYKNIYRSKTSAENPEKFWVEYSHRSIGLGQVVSLTKSGQEPLGNGGGLVSLDQRGAAAARGVCTEPASQHQGTARRSAGTAQGAERGGAGKDGTRIVQPSCHLSAAAQRQKRQFLHAPAG